MSFLKTTSRRRVRSTVGRQPRGNHTCTIWDRGVGAGRYDSRPRKPSRKRHGDVRDVTAEYAAANGLEIAD